MWICAYELAEARRACPHVFGSPLQQSTAHGSMCQSTPPTKNCTRHCRDSSMCTDGRAFVMGLPHLRMCALLRLLAKPCLPSPAQQREIHMFSRLLAVHMLPDMRMHAPLRARTGATAAVWE
eukprot:1160545-Pelagomonas_calceolata.AAC.19